MSTLSDICFESDESIRACLELRWRYLEMCPLSTLEQCAARVPMWPMSAAQDLVVNYVLIFGSLQKYCPPLTYKKSVLKHFSRLIEQSGEELSDSFTSEVVACYHSAAATAIAKPDSRQDENVAFLSYHVPSGPIVALRTQRSYNEVGMTVWGAGLFLAELCLRSNLAAGRVVVELGAGVGCTGIIVMKGVENLSEALWPQQFVMTEGPLEVINNLRHNVDINFAFSNESSIPSADIRPISERIEGRQIFLPLDWTSATVSVPFVRAVLASNHAEGENANKLIGGCIILAADCTYSEDITIHLIETIDLLLRATADTDGASNYALVISTIRQRETFEFFLSQLNDSLGLQYEDVSSWANEIVETGGQLYHIPQRDAIRTIKITLR